jgi:hypothetical protein
MKNHKRFEELIQGYVDNALSNKERQDLENHLKSCKMCEEKLKERKNLLKKLRSGREEISCPDYLINNILKNTTQKEAPVIISSSKIRWRYLAVSAAAVLIIVSTVLLNIEDSKQIMTTKGIEEIQKKEAVEEVKISRSTELSSDKKKAEEIRDEKATIKFGTEASKVPQAPLLEKKVDFAATEKLKGATLSEDMSDFAEAEEIQKKAPILSKAAKAPPSGTIKREQIKETRAFAPGAKTETESVSPQVFEHALLGEGISIRLFEETRFVFPEEGSVVGKDFEIVLILEDPKEAFEIRLDGEKITNYTKDKDSNVIFIGSDSIPPLEEGLHYLSLPTKEEKSITFYKEG